MVYVVMVVSSLSSIAVGRPYVCKALVRVGLEVFPLNEGPTVKLVGSRPMKVKLSISV